MRPHTAQAQTFTNSPYSSFGMGELYPQTLSRGWAMGGSGVAGFDYLSMNRQNPAILADLAITTFDLYGVYNATTLRNDRQSQNYRSGTLGGVVLGLPTRKKVNFAIGLVPYTNVGYGVSDSLTSPLNSSVKYLSRTTGDGGLGLFYIGGAFRPLKKLAVGINLGYLFGVLNEAYITNFPDNNNVFTSQIEQRRRTYVRAFMPEIGATYTDSILKNKWMGRAGFAVQFPVPLSVTQNRTQISADFTTGILITDTNSIEKVGGAVIPPRFSVGLGLLGPRVQLTADFVYQNWAAFRFPLRDQNQKAYWHMALGAEWIPEINSLRYYKRVAYRGGLRYESTNVAVNGTAVQGVVFTGGFGLPLWRQYTRFNVGMAYGIRGTTQNGLIQENYMQVMVGLTFNEIWFLKRKYD